MAATSKDLIVCVVDDDDAVRDSTQMLLGIHGFKVHVYAGARKPTDLAELDAIENVDSVKLDVTKPDEIAAAVQSIE